jgi:butyrate kinase
LTSETTRVLVINPGTTSTKLGIYTRGGAEWEHNITHGDEELARFSGQPMLARLDYRSELIERTLEEAGHKFTTFAAIAGRGGLLRPTTCGTYLVNEDMLEELRLARQGEHASNLGAFLALRFAQAAGVNAYIVDPVTVDEWQECARLSGSPHVKRVCITHALNIKAVARRFASEQGKPYQSLRMIIIHMGSGITVSAHRDGRMIDSNSIEEGPFGPDRTGSLPVKALIKLSFSGKFTQAQLQGQVFGDGGIFAYLGTRDLKEVERRIAAGDAKAAQVFDAMVYQIAKEAGAMAAVLEGKVNSMLLTGGMAYSEKIVKRLSDSVSWIAPIVVYPGENELQALAEGALRVLNNEEEAKTLGAMPLQIAS